MTNLSQKKPINHVFCGHAVPKEGSLIIYHRWRLQTKPLSPQSIARACPLAEARSSYAAPILKLIIQTFQNRPVAQRIGRVAKKLSRYLQHARRPRIKKELSKSRFKFGFFLRGDFLD